MWFFVILQIQSDSKIKLLDFILQAMYTIWSYKQCIPFDLTSNVYHLILQTMYTIWSNKQCIPFDLTNNVYHLILQTMYTILSYKQCIPVQSFEIYIDHASVQTKRVLMVYIAQFEVKWHFSFSNLIVYTIYIF